MTIRIGADIGGTFTDLVVVDEATGEARHTKALTTPRAPAEAVLACLDQLAVGLGDSPVLVHGTTIGINTVLERTGARTALITTDGFRDVLEIGRGDFHRMYDVLYQRPPALVPRRLRLEAPERLSATGEVLTPLDQPAVRRLAERLRQEAVESVAVVFLFSYLNPAHERHAAELLGAALPDAFITASHRVSQEWREYERTSTAVINAYIGPSVERYLDQLHRSLGQRGFAGRMLITQSNGGTCTVESALGAPVTTLESGPAAGVNGCAALSRELQYDRLIAFDMGGTTAKCCIVERGLPSVAEEHAIDGHPIRIPILDIKEVSAGGGTVAWTDAGGALALGPRSAGADPGPACYGRGGTEPTVTDANLVLGRISPSAFLGGRMPLDAAAAGAAIARLGAALGLDHDSTAAGILRLADVKMALALRSITTERGLDPRDYALVAYGGSGPLHAAAIARELAIPRLVVPPAPSTFSAWGMLAADLRHDLVRTVLRPLAETEAAWAGARFEEMREETARVFPTPGGEQARLAVDLRYAGQIHTVSLPLDALAEWDGLRSRFDGAHQQAYGYAAPDVAVELLNLRLTLTRPVRRPSWPTLQPVERDTPPFQERDIYSPAAGRPCRSRVYAREALRPGDVIEGPAAVEEASTTTLIEPGDRLTVNQHGFLDIALAV